VIFVGFRTHFPKTVGGRRDVASYLAMPRAEKFKPRNIACGHPGCNRYFTSQGGRTNHRQTVHGIFGQSDGIRHHSPPAQPPLPRTLAPAFDAAGMDLEEWGMLREGFGYDEPVPEVEMAGDTEGEAVFPRIDRHPYLCGMFCLLNLPGR
jgi:hypothetical protein